MPDGLVVTGWKSRFDIAALSKRCIVLHGNVYDVIREGAETLSVPQWVRRRVTSLTRRPIRRVVRYNCCEPPAILEWDTSDLRAAETAFRNMVPLLPQDDVRQPAVAFRLLGALMRQREPAVVIVDNSEFNFAEPSPAATLLRQMARESPTGEPVTGLAIHIYSSESRVPQDFTAGDPAVAVIPVALPTYEERLAVIDSLPGQPRLLQTRHLGAQVDPRRLAFVTEGFRLSEIEQVAAVAAEQPEGSELSGVLQLYRHGRRFDFWANKDIEELIRARLSARIEGQNRAIDEIIDRVYAAKHRVAEMIEPAGRAPAMVLFLVGPTGVGKTLAAATLCEALTGSQENLKRFDMSEFQRDHSDQRLIGSPPGYVGYSEGGQLTNWVLSRPHSVVLIDEVEKAHERILDVFLQILEGARLTDGRGATVDMSDTILIFTSNLGTEDALSTGVNPKAPDEVEAFFLKFVEDYFRDDLGRPEIYNRLKKGVVVFGYIPDAVGRKVIDDKFELLMQGIHARSGNATTAVFRDEVRELVKAEAKCEQYGLRDVNNAVYDACGGAVGRALEIKPAVPEVTFYRGGKKARI